MPKSLPLIFTTRQALAALTYPDQVALVEEIEKFWRGVSSDSTDE